MPEFVTPKGKVVRITRVFEKIRIMPTPACTGCLGQNKDKICKALPPCSIDIREPTPADLVEKSKRLKVHSRFWVWVRTEPKGKKK